MNDYDAQRRAALRALRRRLRDDKRSATEIAHKAGVSQPTVSRLRSGTAKRLRWSKPFNKLCSMYGVPPVREASGVPDYNALLRAAVVTAWDGTPDTGKILLALIEALSSLLNRSSRSAGRSHGRT